MPQYIDKYQCIALEEVGMNELEFWALVRERQRQLREEAHRPRGEPRPAMALWRAWWGKLSLRRARVHPTPAACACGVQAACCEA